ncbi:SHOCT domain-containing protein [Rhodococcus olei]|uniref:SHOCT domain-containing protein n=1 Tax=Rhodococcus olei TaxID=2161675 RepID=A0ABP8NSX1_9NOCA
MSFWDIIWFIIVSFAFIAYLMLLFLILTDLFRNEKASGWVKAIWVVFLIFLPFLTALVYLIVNGSAMTSRSVRAAQRAKDMQDAYFREVAGRSATAQIADAKALLDTGAITEAEFQALKDKALR